MSDTPEISDTQARLLYDQRLVSLAISELEQFADEKTKEVGKRKRQLKKWFNSLEDLLACKLDNQGELFNTDDMIQPSEEVQGLLDDPTHGMV